MCVCVCVCVCVPLSHIDCLCQSLFFNSLPFFRTLVTVLIAVMTALDQHTDGALTNEFAITMMAFMLEELDGNIF